MERALSAESNHDSEPPFGGQRPPLQERKTLLACLLLLAGLTAAYSNHFHNGFHFDDAHTIVNNGSIRSLGNIPLFFRDGASFSSLPSNQSYRPLVSTLLAFSYSFAGGLHPFWFHFCIFALFAAQTLLLAFVGHQLLEKFSPGAANRWIALAAACWYGLHPATADTVNYIIACSDVISTFGVVASFACYFAFPRWRHAFLYVLPAAITVLAKPPAAVFAVLFALYRLLAPDESSTAKTRLQRAGVWLMEVGPAFLLCGGALCFVQHMTPRNWVGGAANTWRYLITQPYVASLYGKTFLWPNALSADYDLGPFRGTDDPRFATGLIFLFLFTVGAIAFSLFRKTRLIGFGLLWFLIGLLPTSLLPLAEVMNDHRTFLPYVGLIIAAAGVASLIFNRGKQHRLGLKMAATCSVILFLSANGYATHQRNKVWKNEGSLWHDVVVKSPLNPRGLMNYGSTLMLGGDYKGALAYFRRAQYLAPSYSTLLINLAVAEAGTHQPIPAEQHFKEALRLAPSNPDCYTYYSRWLIEHSRAPEALALLHEVLVLAPTDIMANDLLLQAQTAVNVPPTPESYLTLSLHRYREGRYEDAITACRSALALRPDYAEAWNNIGASYNQIGEYHHGKEACEEALRLKPDYPLAKNNLNFAKRQLNEHGR